jgi:FkbM family methyltransferase
VELVSYAQFLEDIRLYRALKGITHGFYIDVGANHPLDHSVTKLFYENGWSGINIEPSPAWFDELIKDRPRDINLKVAASSATGEATFHDIAGTGLSTLIDKFADRGAAAGYPGTTIRVATRRLADICDEHVRGEIHFLKIDVEGAEKAVVEGSDFSRHRPWVILIEATEPMTTIANHFEWEPTLTSNGYLFAGADRVNRYYVAQEHAELLPILALPAEHYRLREEQTEMDRLKTEREALKQEKALLESEKAAFATQLHEQTHQTETLLGEIGALRNRLDQLTGSRIWRMTQPLRTAMDAIQKVRRGAA